MDETKEPPKRKPARRKTELADPLGEDVPKNGSKFDVFQMVSLAWNKLKDGAGEWVERLSGARIKLYVFNLLSLFILVILYLRIATIGIMVSITPLAYKVKRVSWLFPLRYIGLGNLPLAVFFALALLLAAIFLGRLAAELLLYNDEDLDLPDVVDPPSYRSSVLTVTVLLLVGDGLFFYMGVSEMMGYSADGGTMTALLATALYLSFLAAVSLLHALLQRRAEED